MSRHALIVPTATINCFSQSPASLSTNALSISADTSRSVAIASRGIVGIREDGFGTVNAAETGETGEGSVLMSLTNEIEAVRCGLRMLLSLMEGVEKVR